MGRCMFCLFACLPCTCHNILFMKSGIVRLVVDRMNAEKYGGDLGYQLADDDDNSVVG